MLDTSDYRLILLPLMLAFISSLVVFTLASKVYRSDAKAAKRWLTFGALAMGSVICSLHFTGMLTLLTHRPTGYALGYVALSWAIGIVVSWLALAIASQPKLTAWLLIAGSTLLGFGITGMHYASMSAFQLPPSAAYQPVSLLFFVFIAVAASMVGLLILFWLRAQHIENALLPKILAASFISVAIGGMYYTGLAANTLIPFSIYNATSAANPALFAVSIAISASGLILIILIFATLEARSENQKGLAGISIKDANQELSRMAMVDALTQLPNRRFFQQHLDVGVSRAIRMENSLALAFIDLDEFKPVNDAYGHHVGDEVLRMVAKRLDTAVRGCDVVSRIGGDEFVALIEDIKSDQDIIPIVERIVQSLRETFLIEGHEIHLSASVGISVYPRDANVERLMVCADAAMYEAKKNGKNQFRFFDSEIEMTSNRLHKMQRDMQQALLKNDFKLHFQPKLDAQTLELTGIEALLRWQHPDKGLIPPAEFTAAIEQFGLTNQITDWVINESCRTLNYLRIKGIFTQVSINLSAQQLRSPTLVKNILDSLELYDLPPSSLMVEITESSATLNPAQLDKQLGALKTAGIGISLDDFGTGSSSIAHLQNLKVDELKLHGNFIGEIGSNQQTVEIVDAVIKLAHALGLTVVAEGVETEDQRRILTELNCDQLQGFLFTHPVLQEELPSTIQRLSK